MISLEETLIAKELKENILDKNVCFIFNSAVAVNSWTDFIVRQEGRAPWPATIAGERFMAWDQFKSRALKIQKENFSSVPSLLRKLFARRTLTDVQNGREKFERLINSAYSENALSFTDWLSEILPETGTWFSAMRERGFIDSSGALCKARDNPENRDYLKLYKMYSDFLEKNLLFEPTWQGAQFDFTTKRKYIIFYPELLDDFEQYEKILLKAEEQGIVRLVRAGGNAGGENEKSGEGGGKAVRAHFYETMRAELRMTALRILEEHKNKTEWSEIALSVPDLENYAPYVERELRLYNIPFVMRAGTMLGKDGAGLVFRKMLDCRNGGWTFSDMRSLVLDANIPWGDTDAMRRLVELGANLKCFCSFKDAQGNAIDPWLKDLPQGILKSEEEKIYLDTQRLYKSLHDSIEKFCSASSFAAIKRNWEGGAFEKTFFAEKSEMPETADRVLSRCVAKLDELISIEEKYPDIVGSDIGHFDFFVRELESTQYQEQQQKGGVSVFPYKLSALAAFKKQFVINANQKAISVERPPFQFLSGEERRLLLNADKEGIRQSQCYIDAYNKDGGAEFSVAQHALTGYAIPFATLETPDEPILFDKELDEKDFVRHEVEDGATKITSVLKHGYDFYFSQNLPSDAAANADGVDSVSERLQKKILEKVSRPDHFSQSVSGKIFISQSAMKNFFPCPRKWIFNNILRIKEDTLDTDIFEVYDAGKINHKIIELYLRSVQRENPEQRLPLTDAATGRLLDEEKIVGTIRGIIENGSESNGRIELPFELAASYKSSSLAREILLSQKERFVQTIITFLRWFCQPRLFGNWQILAVEKSLQKEVPQSESLVLTGQLDCVLSDGEDCSIVDFKNTASSIPDDANIGADLDDFQMPMYFELWENYRPDTLNLARFVPVNVKSMSEEGHAVIIKEGKGGKKQATLPDFVNYTLPVFDEFVKEMGGAIKNAEYPTERASVEDDCRECDYRAICRRVYNESCRLIKK